MLVNGNIFAKEAGYKTPSIILHSFGCTFIKVDELLIALLQEMFLITITYNSINKFHLHKDCQGKLEG